MGPRKPINYSAHARTAMHERELDEALVQAAAYNPQWRLPDPDRPQIERRFIVVPERDNRVLRVAVLENEQEIRIITAFFDRRARKPE